MGSWILAETKVACSSLNFTIKVPKSYYQHKQMVEAVQGLHGGFLVTKVQGRRL